MTNGDRLTAYPSKGDNILVCVPAVLLYSVKCGVQFLTVARGGQCSAEKHYFLDTEGPLPPHPSASGRTVGDSLHST